MKNLRAVSSRRDGGGTATSFVAPLPALSGEPGERDALCVAARVMQRGTKTQVVFTFEFGEREIQTANMWVEVPTPLTQGCRYMRLVRLALGEDPRAGTPLNPANVFVDKTFRVRVGYRKTAEPRGRGGKGATEELAQRRKDDRDFLRVHDLIEVLS